MKVCEENHRIIDRIFLRDFNKPTGLVHDRGGSDPICHEIGSIGIAATKSSSTESPSTKIGFVN